MDFFKNLFGKPSKDRFAKIVLKAFADVGVPTKFRYVKEDFSLVSDGDQVFNLHNFYDEYCRLSRADREEALKRWAMVQFETIGGIPDDVDEALENLRPKLWMKWSLEILRFQTRLKGNEWKSAPVMSVGTHLCVALVYDLPHAMASIVPDQLEKWGISFHQAFNAARENLSETPAKVAHLGESFFASVTGDNYDASRIVLLDRLQQLPVKGELIVAVPNRDSLLVTGSEDPDGLRVMFDLVKAAMSEPRPMSPIPLRLVGDQWFDWDLPSTLPMYHKWRALQMEFLGGIYGEQKQYLEALNEKAHEDVFVATYSCMRKKTGEGLSFCIWGEGIPTLLPKTDIVYIGRQDKTAVMVEWDQMELVVGELVEPTDHYPPRYRVNSFPSNEEFGRLQSVAFEP